MKSEKKVEKPKPVAKSIKKESSDSFITNNKLEIFDQVTERSESELEDDVKARR